MGQNLTLKMIVSEGNDHQFLKCKCPGSLALSSIALG